MDIQPADIEPLDPLTWFAEVEKLQSRRAHLDGEVPDALLRKTFYLTQLVPHPLQEYIPVRVDEATVEAFLECGAYESAAIALLPPPTMLSLCRAEASKKTVASVRLAGSHCAGEDEDEEPAKALLGAWCRAVLALRMDGAELTTSPQDQRTLQSAQDRHLTKH